MSMIAAIQGFATHGLKRGPSPRPRVLIVDDEEPVRMFVDRVLRGAGYETALAGDAAAALRQASKPGSFDVVVTDLMMPEMSGDELARRMREVDPLVKVLYLTGFSDHLFNEKVTLWADEAFLDKPCSIKGLLEAVSLLVTGTLAQHDGLPA
jgi:two-component system cell cycle sensor histidine kinase/response regulator CckA